MLQPDKDLILQVSEELAIDESFIEKDWYVTQALVALSQYQDDDFSLSFSGGTSLSKAYQIIQRFSEDIDFRIAPLAEIPPKRASRRRLLSTLKNRLLTHLRESGFAFDETSVTARNDNHYFGVEIDYQTHFNRHGALRPHLKVEFVVKPPSLPPQSRSIASFVAELTKSDPEIDALHCLDPVENAADKVSALTWRVLVSDRKKPQSDYTFIRHLYDLAKLSARASQHPSFVTLAIDTLHYDRDEGRFPHGTETVFPKESLRAMQDSLNKHRLYLREYKKFVQAMSYVSDDFPDYRQALERLDTLVSLIVEQCE